MQTVLIVGGGQGGLAILKILQETRRLNIIGLIDTNESAPALSKADELGIPVGKHWHSFLKENPDIIIEVTGDQTVFEELRAAAGKQTILIPGSVAYLLANLLDEKEKLISRLSYESYKYDLIFESIDEGMIGIDQSEKIILFNKSAERILGVQKEKAMGSHILDVIPTSKLPLVLKKTKSEINQEQLLENGVKVITSRIPMIAENGEIIGAFSVFKDITEIVNLAKEITNLREIQTMLEAIIHSSDDAISVVDEQGRGILINPAYT
ncbi:MAG TPA: PAS domain S-box protein, partial [Chondromyces sp.]|nr:PAS domain S-box protein [Chondromyces sp.]